MHESQVRRLLVLLDLLVYRDHVWWLKLLLYLAPGESKEDLFSEHIMCTSKEIAYIR